MKVVVRCRVDARVEGGDVGLARRDRDRRVEEYGLPAGSSLWTVKVAVPRSAPDSRPQMRDSLARRCCAGFQKRIPATLPWAELENLTPSFDRPGYRARTRSRAVSSKVKRLLRPPVTTATAVAAVAAPMLTLSSTARDLICRFRPTCGDPAIAPVLAPVAAMPGRAIVGRDLDARNDAAADIGSRAGDRNRLTWP